MSDLWDWLGENILLVFVAFLVGLGFWLAFDANGYIQRWLKGQNYQ